MDSNIRTCKYKLYIECVTKDRCNKCGWNPEVENRRKRRLKKTVKNGNNKWVVGEKKDRSIEDEEK